MTTCRYKMGIPLVSALVVIIGWVSVSAQEPQRPTFRSAVDLVRVSAVVRDHHGRFVSNLKKDDFRIDDAGVPRTIADFHADTDAPVKVALLFDVSGSMRLAFRLQQAREAARQVLSSLRLESSTPGEGDQAAVFSFDIGLQSLQPFTADPQAIESALSRVAPYGETSLYDAIAQTSRRVSEGSPNDNRRKAVIVFTDGVDTSSRMKPEQVAAIASAVDVPVYVLAVMATVDRDAERVDPAAGAPPESTLRTLAQWTGGDLFVTSAPAQQSVAARQIVDELRHQYVLAFAAPPVNGWRPLSVRVNNRDLTVRARSGYTAGGATGS